MLLSLAFALVQQASAPPKHAPLDSVFIVGWIGDANRDGTPDFAVVGRDLSRAKETKLTASLIVYSGKTLAELYRVPLPEHACKHDSVHVIDDRDGDGLNDVIVCSDITTIHSTRDGKLLAKLERATQFVGHTKQCDGNGHDELILNHDTGPVVWRVEDNSLDELRFAACAGWATSVGDIDGDDVIDLVPLSTYVESRARVFSGATGKAIFELVDQPQAAIGYANVLGCEDPIDLDGDGLRDVVVLGVDEEQHILAAFSGKNGKLLRRWSPHDQVSFSDWASHPMAIGDIDDDGQCDLAFALTTANDGWVEKGPTIVALSGATFKVLWSPRLKEGARPSEHALVLPGHDGFGRVKMLFASYGNEYDDGGADLARSYGEGWLFAMTPRGDVLAKIAP